MTRDSLIRGTIILAAAAFVARFLGVVQRVPLQNMLGDQGMATYGIAYNIYALLLIVATAGIPSALSKLVSEKMALGQFAEASKIYRAAVWFALSTGVIITALLIIFAPAYAKAINDEDAVLAIRALAPAMLVFPLIAIMRGYFQGRQTMMPGGLSQIVEQIMRVATAVALAYFILDAGYSIAWGAAGASFGGVAGAVGAILVMLIYQWRLSRSDEMSLERSRSRATWSSAGYRQIYKAILRLSIPISIISMAVPMIYFIDSSMTIPLLQGDLGKALAKETLGILTGRAQSIAGIPPILAIALSMSIIPVVSSAYAKNDLKEVADKASQALRIALLSGLPLVLTLSVAARPINGLLYVDTLGTPIIVLSTTGALFQILMMTSGAILMGLGQTIKPMIYVIIGIIVKIALSFILGVPFGIYGIITASILCFIVVMLLNLRALRQQVAFRLLGRRWYGVVGATVSIGIVGIVLDWLTSQAGTWTAPRLDYLWHALLISAATMGLYPVLIIAFRAVTDEDIRSFPAPARKLLALIRRPSRVKS